MANNFYEIDTTIRLLGTFTAVTDGSPIDPTTVSLYVEDPNRNVAVYTLTSGVVKDGVGLYHYDLTPTVPGNWYYKWRGSGNANVTSPDTLFVVQSSRLLASG